MISAAIDIGSNSIKLLVARSANAEPVFEDFSETRLSPNAKNASRERISPQAFDAGLRAVETLIRRAREFSPEREIIVGTQLFRCAENAPEFARAIETATGTPMRILSGEEEASLVAAGVATDPAVSTPCAIFDLGGGSLEFIAVPANAPHREEPLFAASHPLGAVVLTRRFFRASEGKIPVDEISALREHVRATLAEFLPAKIPHGAQAVFCGGAAGIASGHFLKSQSAGTPGGCSAEELENLLAEMAQKTARERILSGVPEKRADIFPAALATLAEICRQGAFPRFVHSKRNLRYGLCATLNAEA